MGDGPEILLYNQIIIAELTEVKKNRGGNDGESRIGSNEVNDGGNSRGSSNGGSKRGNDGVSR